MLRSLGLLSRDQEAKLEAAALLPPSALPTFHRQTARMGHWPQRRPWEPGLAWLHALHGQHELRSTSYWLIKTDAESERLGGEKPGEAVLALCRRRRERAREEGKRRKRRSRRRRSRRWERPQSFLREAGDMVCSWAWRPPCPALELLLGPTRATSRPKFHQRTLALALPGLRRSG